VNGSLLLSQFLHDDPVLRLKCRTWQPYKNYGTAEQVQEDSNLTCTSKDRPETLGNLHSIKCVYSGYKNECESVVQTCTVRSLINKEENHVGLVTIQSFFFPVNKMDWSDKNFVACLNLNNLQLLTRCLRLYMIFLVICNKKQFGAIICPIC